MRWGEGNKKNDHALPVFSKVVGDWSEKSQSKETVGNSLSAEVAGVGYALRICWRL